MLDAKRLLDELLGSNVPGTTGSVRDQAGKAVQMAKDNPLAAGAIAAVLLGTGAGRKVTGSAVKLGGLAAIGGLAYKAYQQYKQGQEATPVAKEETKLLPPPAESPFNPAMAPQGETEFALVLVRAMISAAKADGHIDEDERSKIAGRMNLAGLGADAEAFINAELQRPLNLDDLVSSAQTDAQKVELYTASRLAISADTRAERGYLDLLAGRLNLPDPLVDQIEQTIEGATVPMGANQVW